MPTAKNEAGFNQNTQNARFSTNNALGFTGGSQDPTTGNIVTPTALQVSGVNQAPTSTTNTTAVDPTLPSGPGRGTLLAESLAGPVAGSLASPLLKSGAGAIKDFFAPPTTGIPTSPTGIGNMGSTGLNPEIGTPQTTITGGETAAAGTIGGATVGAGVGSGLGPEGGALVGSGLGPEGIGAGVDAATASGVVDSSAAGIAAAGDAAAGGSGIADFFTALLAGCFITEAVMSSGGADNGIELETLRGFRDNILMKTPQGQAMIAEYNAIAPVVVEAIGARPDAMQIYQQIKSQFIDPAVAAVQQGNHQQALQIYAQMIGAVTPFAAEAAEKGMGGPQTQQPGAAPAINQLGDHANVVAQNPGVAAAAIPGAQPGAAPASPQQYNPAVDAGDDDDGMMAAGGMMPNGGMMPMRAAMQPPAANGAQWGPRQVAPPAIGETFARRY